ncbi:MAG: hypothetical protein ACK4SJ_05840 [Sphingorhabdus sp.]
MAKIKTIAALAIIAHQDVRFRAGRQFTREETVIALDDLKEEEIEALHGDPLLTVTETEMEVEGEPKVSPPPPPPPPPPPAAKDGDKK